MAAFYNLLDIKDEDIKLQSTNYLTKIVLKKLIDYTLIGLFCIYISVSHYYCQNLLGTQK